MKRKLLSLLIVMVMGMSLLVGCGGNSNENKDNDTLQNIDNVQEGTTVENSEIKDNDTLQSSDNVQEGTTVENTEIEEKEEIDTSIYSEKVELTTGEGKVVSIYYDPTIVTNLSGEDWTGKEEINLGEMMSIYVTDAESAKAYVDTVIDDNGGNIDIGKQEEIQLSGYTIHYFTLNKPESGAFLDKIWLIELDSDVVCRFMVIGKVTEGSQLEKELEAIKFVVGDENDSENIQNDNNEVVPKGNLQTLEFPTYIKGKTGVITYNGDFVEVTDSDKITGADFDVKVKDGKTTYTIGVTLSVDSNMEVAEEIQDDKEWMEKKAKTFQFSEIKETTINKIPVQYYLCTYTTEREGKEHEHTSFKCFIEFPTINKYYNYTIMLSTYDSSEETLVFSALENLLVDVEILGVKPLGVVTEGTAGENEWPVFLPERPETFEVLEVTVDQDNNATHYSIDVGLVDYQTVKDYVDEIKNAGCDLENGHEKYSEESGYIAFVGVLDNHIITVYYDVEWNVFEIIIGE